MHSIDHHKIWETVLQGLESGQASYHALRQSPVVLAAQPAILAVGSLLGALSGYEIGHTLVLKAKNQWHPSLARPVVLLTATVALTAFASPYFASAIGVITVSAAAFGALKACFAKKDAGQLDFASFQKAYGSIPEGVALVSPKAFSQLTNPTKQDVCGLIWHLTKTACDQGESFTEGTYVLEGDAAEDVYHQLGNMEDSYPRISTHFKGRCQKTYPQKGLDFASKDSILPASKRTILFGLADTHDGKKVLFIKPENWGTDHPKSIFDHEKIKHFVNHTLQLFHAQYVKIMRPGYDDRPGTAKERIPVSWKSANSSFGWGALSPVEKQNLITQGLAKSAWMNDTYRTGREVYVQI